MDRQRDGVAGAEKRPSARSRSSSPYQPAMHATSRHRSSLSPGEPNVYLHRYAQGATHSDAQILLPAIVSMDSVGIAGESFPKQAHGVSPTASGYGLRQSREKLRRLVAYLPLLLPLMALFHVLVMSSSSHELLHQPVTEPTVSQNKTSSGSIGFGGGGSVYTAQKFRADNIPPKIPFSSSTLESSSNLQAGFSLWTDDSVKSLTADGSSASASSFQACGSRGRDLQKGTALLAVCMNRHDTYALTSKTWANVVGVDEIIIVDWSSDPPLEPPKLPLSSPKRVKVIRVEGEEHWVLSRAFNLGMSVACREVVLRVDCDYRLARNFLQKHALSSFSHAFYAGNWKLARNTNEVHLNGALLLHWNDFWKVGGYDERIQTYGWDDEDLYERLQKVAKLERKDVSPDLVTHTEHQDSRRARTDVRFPAVHIDYNRLILDKLQPWRPGGVVETNDTNGEQIASGVAVSRYEVVKRGELRSDDTETTRVLTVRGSARPLSLSELVDLAEAEKMWMLALGRRLHDHHSVPWDILMSMDVSNREKLLSELVSYMESNSVEREDHAALFVLHACHGLGARLLSLASAMAFSKMHHMQLIVIWQRDSHLDVDLEDLFDLSGTHFVVTKRFKTTYPGVKNSQKWDPIWINFAQMVSVLSGEDAEAAEIKPLLVAPPPYVDRKPRHIYWKSNTLLSPENGVSWAQLQEQLQSLRPSEQVQRSIDKKTALLVDATNNLPLLGAHARSLTAQAEKLDFEYEKEFGLKELGELNTARAATRVEDFVAYFKTVREIGDRMVVVSDDHKTKALLCVGHESDVECTQQEDWDECTTSERTPECAVSAMSDLKLLGRTKTLIGSRRSSFTLAAAMLQDETKLLFTDDAGNDA